MRGGPFGTPPSCGPRRPYSRRPVRSGPRRSRWRCPASLSSSTGPGVRARRGRRTRWPPQQAHRPRPRADAMRRADRARRPRTRLHQPQPGRRLRHPRRRGTVRPARAATSAPAARTPRSTPCARPVSDARGGTAVRHPRTLQPHRPHRPLRPGAHRGRNRPGRLRRRRPEPAGHRRRATPCAAAGVDVEQGLLADEAEAGNAAWLTSVRLGRPYVLWKYAATLDGRIAAADGTSRWITSPESRADVHRLRAEADAVDRRLRHRPRRRPASRRARRRRRRAAAARRRRHRAPPPCSPAPASWTTRRPP